MSTAQDLQTAEEANEDALMRGMTPNELRMLNLLGAGVPQEMVAATCGVTAAHVSQLMDLEGFKSLVAKLRYEKLQEQANIDSKYDEMEAKLQKKMETIIPMLTKPRDILDFQTRLNAMKRRGQAASANPNGSNAGVVINLQLPTAILNKIVVDPTTNRVIEANGQEMITLPSNNMAETLNDHRQSQRSISDASEKISIPRRPVSARDL